MKGNVQLISLISAKNINSEQNKTKKKKKPTTTLFGVGGGGEMKDISSI